ncbi:MAG: bifunctional glutamate N-acetyltransferase/amino-acid acetyltransferase ArgJ [Candidatus Aureabacteria bacterium]|nr:bifunctional glutamate N-acetyltransferase/amino-acid acetyltransferase ArgJ [Candidatus Auribacterota bacterium]
MSESFIRNIPQGSITTPKGFKAAGGHCGIKRSGKKDLAIIYSDAEETIAKGLFTTNTLPAAPVLLSRLRLRNGRLRAVVINSGVANACTGQQGYKNADEVTEEVANILGLKKNMVAMCSTGKIGVPLPVETIKRGLKYLSKKISSEGGHYAAEAIMTTDTREKQLAYELTLNSGKVRIGAMAKGAGMINPNMATMLALITTDARITAVQMKKILTDAVEMSFNKINIDGDMSTNDSVIAMANGLSEVEVRPNSADEKMFREAFNKICLALAEMIVRDGEGATKFVKIKVTGAKTRKDASLAARAVSNSILFKVALYGQNPNWGRLMDALGYSGASISADKISVKFGDIEAVKGGVAVDDSEHLLKTYMKQREVDILIDLSLGSCQEEILTCDIGRRYIEINI